MYNESGDYSVRVCYSPLSWHLFAPERALVIVADVFRATTAMCAAFENQVRAIIPLETIAESEDYKARGYICAGERDGKTLDCADFGNSPYNFMDPALRGKVLTMNTTNGTRAIRMASAGDNLVLIGALTNLSAVCDHAVSAQKDVVIFCAGWKDRFSMEDTLFAGAAVQKIIESGQGSFHTTCDSAIAAVDLWTLAAPDPVAYIQKAAHRHRLKKLGLDDIIEYSLTPDATSVVPIYHNDRLINKDDI